MAKAPTLTTVSSGYYSTTALNDNFNEIMSWATNTVSRDGSIPNAMSADLDMDSNHLLNVGSINTAVLKINGVAYVPAELAATSPQVYDTVADLVASTETDRGTGSIWQAGGYAYTEVSSGGHITNAGGAELKVIPMYGGFYAAAAFNVKGDNSTDDAAAIQNAYDSIMAEGGGKLCFGDGTFIVGTSLDFESPSASTFNQGVQILGAGIGSTIFDNRVSSAPMMDVSAGGTAGTNFLMGAVLSGFKIISTTGSSQVGIRLNTAYQVSIRQVHIDGMSGTGLHIPCTLGDDDGSNMVSLDQVRIENCSDWGIDAKSDSGHNENSFITMDHVFIQACGTASAAATPPSGGMRWKGQMLTTRQCAFVLSQNVGLFIPGEAGLAQSCFLYDTTFENNVKRGIYCTGIKSFKGRNVQFYNNDSFVANNAVEFDGTSFTVDEVRLKGVIIRATSGNNAYTAFKLSGGNVNYGNCSVEEVVYDNFGYSGQVKQEGFQNDPVAVVQKTGAQNVFNTISAIVFDSEVTDLQSRYDTSNGQWTINYETYAQFTGQLTITGLSAGDEVVIELYEVESTTTLATTTLAAAGLTDESFRFDFIAPVGSGGLTRRYQIRALQDNGGVGSRALNVSDAQNNTLHVRRASNGEV